MASERQHLPTTDHVMPNEDDDFFDDEGGDEETMATMLKITNMWICSRHCCSIIRSPQYSLPKGLCMKSLRAIPRYCNLFFSC